MENKVRDDLMQYAAALAADHQTQRITEATLAILSDAERNSLQKIALQRAGMSAARPQGAAQAQGWLFEQLEATKFNLNALKQGSDLRAATTDALGKINDPTTDIIISRGKRQLREFQLKSGNRASSTAFMLADKKYGDVGLVGPADQHAEVQHLYKARVASGTLKADEYASAQQRLHKGIQAENISSGGTKYSEALDATDPQLAAKLDRQFKHTGIATEMHNSGLEAGKTGAVISGGVSAVSGLLRLARGEANTGEIVAQVAVDAAKGYAIGYTTTAISKGIPHAAISVGMEKSAANLLTKSNAHIAIAAGVIQSGKSLTRYLRGEIDSEQMLSEVSHTAITGANTFYYGALGQALIPVPFLGAFIGSTVGYFVGNMLHQSGLVSLGETAAIKVARERREHVESLCITAIPLMRAHRLELEKLLSQHFAERQYLLSTAFDRLESSLLEWDTDDFGSQLEQVNNAFGASLPFKTFAEFDAFMVDEERTFIL